MDIARLVRDLMKVTDKNQAELAKELGVTQPSVSRWSKGSAPKSDQKDVIVNYAQKVGVLKPTDHFRNESVPIVGYVGAGGAILYEEGQGPFGEAPVPPWGMDNKTVAVVVRGDSMAPQLEDGWMVYYNERRDPPGDDLLGKTCVLGLHDGRVLIKKLVRGRKAGHFDLYSVNGAMLLDQPVSWAARITWIAPT